MVAGQEPIHSNPPPNWNASNPRCEATLMTKGGTNTRNPQAALRPIPMKAGMMYSIIHGVW